MTTPTIHRVPALKDNYAWLVVDEASGEAAVVDPSEAAPVAAAVERLGVRLVAIWNTHHHWDHTGGNEELVRRFGPLAVHASAHDRGRVAAQTVALDDGETFALGRHEVRALHIPGHTLGHLAYVVGDAVFCGDTLFGAGCGRLFEGTPELMVASLGRLRALPPGTRAYCGHEYTLANLRFAATIEPANAELAARLERVAAQPDAPTVPLDLDEERRTNPFLRWDVPAVAAQLGTEPGVATFAAVRKAKDGWRG